jgi:hypothetical protein
MREKNDDQCIVSDLCQKQFSVRVNLFEFDAEDKFDKHGNVIFGEMWAAKLEGRNFHAAVKDVSKGTIFYIYIYINPSVKTVIIALGNLVSSLWLFFVTLEL